MNFFVKPIKWSYPKYEIRVAEKPVFRFTGLKEVLSSRRRV